MAEITELYPKVAVAAEARNILGESPVWSSMEAALYWTDIRAPALYRFDARTREVTSWALSELAGAVALRRRKGLVLGLQSGLYAFTPDAARLERLYKFDGRHPEDRTNDSRCDGNGRLWFSTMRDYGKAKTGTLECLDAQFRSVCALRGLTIPNGICFSPAGDLLYFTDTSEGTVHSYAGLDSADHLHKHKIILPPDLVPGKPDGATVDAEGHIWSARYGGGCLVRSSPTGHRHAIYRLPVSQPTSCSFGGRGLDQLFITTASQGLDARQSENEPLAGRLLVIEPGVKGLDEPGFAG